jgi:hypothetical protein
MKNENLEKALEICVSPFSLNELTWPLAEAMISKEESALRNDYDM